MKISSYTALFTIISFDTDSLELQSADFILGDNTFSAIFLDNALSQNPPPSELAAVTLAFSVYLC